MTPEFEDAESDLRRPFDPRMVGWLLGFLEGKLGVAWGALGLMLLGALASLAGPWLTKRIIDNSIVRQDEEALLLLVGAFAAFHLLAFVVKALQVTAMSLLGQTLMSRLRLDLFYHILRLPKKFFDVNPTGKTVARVTSDVEALNELLTSGLIVFVGDGILLVGIAVFMMTIHWQLALVTLLVLPFIAVAFVIFRSRVTALYRTERTLVARLHTTLQESISGMGIIQLFQREAISAREFGAVNEGLYRTACSSVLSYTTFFPFISFLASLAKALVVWYGGFLFLENGITLGAIVAFLGYVQMFFGPLHDMSEKYNIFQAAMAASEKVKGAFSEPLSPEYERRSSPDLPVFSRGEIEFRNVWFAYRDEEWVLRDVSFHIAPGESVAIVGQTGSGKTTIISLIGRFYEVSRGQILLDGRDIREWDVGELRRVLGIVLQDVFLFSGPLSSNVTLFDENLSEESVLEAIRALGAESFVARLPKGISTDILERGKSLSVGQRQLLAFARTMIRRPGVLILDEATANVDSETERFIQEATRRLTEGRTAIVIAHRLSTIRSADKIVVMHRGQVREWGTHRELMDRRGIYRDLYDLQYREQESQ